MAIVEPLAMATDPGTASVAVLLESVTTTPPDAAALESVTTQLETPPEARLVGEQVSDCSVAGADSKVKDCVCELPFKEAVTTAVCVDEIVPAAAVKVVDVPPFDTVTEDGTESAGLLLERATVTPLEPAACDSDTEQTDVPPEVRVDGEHDNRLTKAGASSEIDAVCELPP